jgi:hypothetical protein
MLHARGRQYFTRRFLTLGIGLIATVSTYAQPNFNPDYNSIVPGFEYAHIQTTNLNGEPLSIHIARLDRSAKDLQVASVLSQNEIFGNAPLSTIAKTVPQRLGTPLALINTGFCINKKDPYYGMPRGIVITDGELAHGPYDYSFWVNESGEMNFGKVESKFSVTLDGVTYPIGLNEQCKSNQIVLFTHILGKSTRATNDLELVLEAENGKEVSWHAGQSYSLRIKTINTSGNSPLSDGVAVLSFDAGIAEKARKASVGDKIKLELATLPDLSQATTASECIFPIVQNGTVLKEFQASKYMLQKHPRTAIGFNTRYFFMVVVDGRRKEISMGMKPDELGSLMLTLGCTEAMNLDGGGSSTFWADGKTRNSVAGSRERDRSDALVVVKKSPRKVSLNERH